LVNYLPIRPITYLVNISNNENNPQIQHTQLYPIILPWAIILSSEMLSFFFSNNKNVWRKILNLQECLFVEMKISKLINYSNRYVWEAPKVLLLLLWVWFTVGMTFEPQASFIHPRQNIEN
jgi:hypothetical protein